MTPQAQTLSTLSRAQKLQLLEELEERERRAALAAGRADPIGFARKVYPGYSVGAHHKVIGRVLADIAAGRKKRVIINMPPRHGKSELASYLFPAWYLGTNPTHHVIMATHTASLSEEYGRRVRNLIESEDYRELFSTSMQEDSKGAGNWSTADGGKYYAVGTGGALAGRGAHLLIIDDPHSEQDLKSGTKTVFEQAFQWYQTGPRQRMMWGGAIVLVMTRWGPLDLTAKILDYAARNPDSDQWEVIEFPAILHEKTDKEKSLWPEKWPLDQMRATRASILPRYWNAQYQQNPTADEMAIIKREHWKMWEAEDPPKVEYVIQSWDTAHEAKTASDYSACTTWGVWYNEKEKSQAHLILLDAFKDRMEFPELKRSAFEHWKKWQPDAFIVEKKAAGAPLIQELRAMGIPVNEFSPSRGNDKTVRVNAVADIFASGKVWAPDTRWAREVMEELAAFPAGEHDDYVDTTTQALLRYRQGGFIRLDSDEAEQKSLWRRRRAYY